MQIVNVTRGYLASPQCTTDILTCIATESLGLSKDDVIALGLQGKLVKTITELLETNEGYHDTFKEGNLQLEISCLPDLNIANAGANKARGQRRAPSQLTGPYKVVNSRALKCTEASDPTKFALWQLIWGSNSYEEFFQKAKDSKMEKVVTTSTNRLITARSEINWATKCGWILPVSKEVAEQQAAPVAEQQEPATMAEVSDSNVVPSPVAAPVAEQQEVTPPQEPVAEQQEPVKHLPAPVVHKGKKGNKEQHARK